jgi:cytochrome c553
MAFGGGSMKLCTMLLAAAVATAIPAAADDRPLDPSSRPYQPKLGDIMGATQLRHFKLWYAGKEKNWGLANYELAQIKDSFSDAMTFYPGLPVADMTPMVKPAAAIAAAIKAKDSGKFAAAFGELTTACNACHQAQGLGFIVIKIPSASPFSNQSFAPK